MAPRVHVKGRLLQLLAEQGPQRDYELAAKLAAESGERETQYWHDSIRLTLADLTASGLVLPEHEHDTVDPTKTFGEEKLVCRYVLTDFGKQRLRETNLLPAGV